MIIFPDNSNFKPRKKRRTLSKKHLSDKNIVKKLKKRNALNMLLNLRMDFDLQQEIIRVRDNINDELFTVRKDNGDLYYD